MRSTFVVDLDGTLLRSDGTLLSEARDHLIGLQDQGYALIIATGRKYEEAREILRQLKLKEYKNAAIVSDGQCLIDYRDGTESVAPYLAYPEDYITVMQRFDHAASAVKLITPKQDYDVFPSVFCFAMWKRIFKRAMKFRNPFRGLLISPAGKVESVEKITVRPYRADTTPSGDAYALYQVAFVHDKKRFEFKPKGVNKSESLKQYLAKYNISPDTVFVFGNDENDFCLFDDFSNSFVVDTASENVKSRARTIIRHDEGLGVIEKINNIIAREKHE